MDNSRAIRAEQSLLGCLLLDGSVWDLVSDLVTSGDLVRAEHRWIWDAIAALATRGEPIDVVMVADAMQRAGTLARVDHGLDLLRMLESETPSAVNAPAYARVVREQSVLRQVADRAAEVVRESQAPDAVASAVLAQAQQRLGEIAEQAIRGAGPQPMPALIRETIEHLEAICQRGESILGQPSGYPDLDKKTSGLMPGDLVILAARPSMGKTTLAQCLAEQAALNAAHPVVFFSLEMSRQSLMLRLISSVGRVDHGALRIGNLDDEGWQRVAVATGRLNTARLLIDDAAGLTVDQIAARARRVHRQSGGLSLIIVDYLQLIATTGKTENRNVEVMRISQGLKALSKSLNVPVVALSQLNRGVEQRTNKRPLMSDLRDSGGIEQDADLVLMLYRDEVYNPDSPDAGTAELIIAKQRNGETGTVRLAFIGKYCRFDALAYDYKPPPREKPTRYKKSMEY